MKPDPLSGEGCASSHASKDGNRSAHRRDGALPPTQTPVQVSCEMVVIEATNDLDGGRKLSLSRNANEGRHNVRGQRGSRSRSSEGQVVRRYFCDLSPLSQRTKFAVPKGRDRASWRPIAVIPGGAARNFVPNIVEFQLVQSVCGCTSERRPRPYIAMLS